MKKVTEKTMSLSSACWLTLPRTLPWDIILCDPHGHIKQYVFQTVRYYYHSLLIDVEMKVQSD